ncbi:MAG TPA: sialidase family protein, partial [Gemmatimonadales bacterium]|nr:sialidase family protein [Gemmatimonadales bacterium]
MNRTLWPILAVALVLAPTALPGQRRTAPTPAPAARLLDTLLYRGLKFRAIGPSTMGGRMSAFAVREANPRVIFAAAGTGGLFKTTNNGTTWSAVFEDQPVASIGAVAVSQRDSNLVWVGTGEGNGRNSSSWGNGVYRSTDGGGKWTHLGLDNTHDIPALAIDPHNDSTVWVAALGHLWGKNSERGVYKTTDGGKTWTAVLTISADTGVSDIVCDPQKPDTLF